MKKLFLCATIAVLSSTFAFAAPTAQECVSEIKTRQQSDASLPKINDRQALSYCECAITKVNKLVTTDNDLGRQQSQVNQVLQQCSRDAGISK